MTSGVCSIKPSVMFMAVLMVLVFRSTPSEASYGLGASSLEKSFIEYYSSQKLLCKCYGDGTLDPWQLRLDRIFERCSSNVTIEAIHRMDETYGLMKNMMEERKRNSNIKPFFCRIKLRDLAEELLVHVKKLGCVFDALDLKVCTSGVVLAKPIKDYINKEALDAKLKSYLIEEVDKCERKTICGDYRLLGKSHSDFFKLVKFFNCWQDARLKACIRRDIDGFAGDYDLTGLMDFASDLDVSKKRLFTTAAYYNDQGKLGGLWNFY